MVSCASSDKRWSLIWSLVTNLNESAAEFAQLQLVTGYYLHQFLYTVNTELQFNMALAHIMNVLNPKYQTKPQPNVNCCTTSFSKISIVYKRPVFHEQSKRQGRLIMVRYICEVSFLTLICVKKGLSGFVTPFLILRNPEPPLSGCTISEQYFLRIGAHRDS